MNASSPREYPQNKWVVAIAVTFGTLMAAIDTSIVNVALPHLRGTLSATVEEITWVSTGYVVASVITMPLTAWLGARFGRKRIYLAGLVVFLVG
jgi:DHA2 family multidrug resistance protein